MSWTPSKLDSTSWSTAWKEGWERFWFAPGDPRPLAAVRIIVGLTAFIYLWSFSYDLERWFGPQGLLPQDAVEQITRGPDEQPLYRYTLLSLAGSKLELWLLHGGCLAMAAAMTVGLATRATTALTLVAVLSYVHRAPMLGSSLDPVLSMFLLYLCLAPAGSWCSLDRRLGMPAWLYGSSEPGIAATISLRLMQIHLSGLYAVMGISKLYGNAWWDGEAIWLLVSQTHSRPLDLSGLRNWPYLLNGWSHLVVYTQLAFAPLVWSRLARPIILMLAALTWLSLIPVTGQTLFCLFMTATLGIYMPQLLSRLLGSSGVSLPAPGGVS